jgi:hypothetical protein
MKYLIALFLFFFCISCKDTKNSNINKKIDENEVTYIEDTINDNLTKSINPSITLRIQRKLDEEFIYKNIEVGKLCILRSGELAEIIDKTDTTYTFYMVDYREYWNSVNTFTISTEHAIKIIKRFETIDKCQNIEYIKANCEVGRDCILKYDYKRKH